LSGAAPVPWRSRAAEDALQGRRLEAKTIREAAEAVVEGADPLPGNAYKLDLLKGVLTEELHAVRSE
jgi:xanthine dehydrogenase YagS FAD-binding subunit